MCETRQRETVLLKRPGNKFMLKDNSFQCSLFYFHKTIVNLRTLQMKAILCYFQNRPLGIFLLGQIQLDV